MMLALFALPVALAAAIPDAKTAADEEVICVTILTRWAGSNDDIRDIGTTPVPASYRRLFAPGPCNSLDVPALVSWHLAFGDERSTDAALAFLRQSSRFAVPEASGYLRTMRAAWARDLPVARAIDDRRRAGWTAATDHAFNRDAAVRRLRGIVDTYGRFVFLAEEHLRAAEFYGSGALFELATEYLTVASAGLEVIAPGARISMADGDIADRLGLLSGAINRVRDLEARAAVLRARLTGTAADRNAATALLDTGDVGLLRLAAEEAFTNGDDVCDTNDRASLAAIATACAAENDFEGRLNRYWRARAQLDLLTDRPEGRASDSFELAVRLLAHQRRGSDAAPFTGFVDGADDAIADLLIQRSDAIMRPAGKTGGNDPARGVQDRLGAIGSALTFLARAARSTPPANNPGRFRQVAARYLVIWAQLPPDPNDAWLLKGELAREAASMRRTLAALDEIATGR